LSYLLSRTTYLPRFAHDCSLSARFIASYRIDKFSSHMEPGKKSFFMILGSHSGVHESFNFWDIKPYSSLKNKPHFGGTCLCNP
jgi:hypothetical protein